MSKNTSPSNRQLTGLRMVGIPIIMVAGLIAAMILLESLNDISSYGIIRIYVIMAILIFLIVLWRNANADLLAKLVITAPLIAISLYLFFVSLVNHGFWQNSIAAGFGIGFYLFIRLFLRMTRPKTNN